MNHPRLRIRVLAALLAIAALGIPPRGAAAQDTGVAPGGPVVAVGFFDFLTGKKWRVKLADAERRQAQAEADARAAREDAARAQAALAREHADREREHGEYARTLEHLAAYSRDADDQRALVGRLRNQLERETALALDLRHRMSATEHSIADVTPAANTAAPAPVVTAPRQSAATHARGQRHHRGAPNTSVGWGTI